MNATKTSTLNPALGAFARAAIAELAAEGWRFVSLVAGVVTIEHPEHGRLDFDNDNYASKRVTHNWREGFYADALFTLEASNDDGEFERSVGTELGTDTATFVPVYDRHAAYRFDPTAPDRIEVLAPSELAALGDDERPDFDSAEALAAVLAGVPLDDEDEEGAADSPDADDDAE